MYKPVGIIFALSLIVLLLAAANPWPARLTVINQTGDDIYISLDYPYPWLVVKAGDSLLAEEKPTTIFTIERGVYNAQVTACGMTALGKIDLNRNLLLNFTACDQWFQDSAPKYLGEPSQEKPNWFRTPGTADWQLRVEPES